MLTGATSTALSGNFIGFIIIYLFLHLTGATPLFPFFAMASDMMDVYVFTLFISGKTKGLL